MAFQITIKFKTKTIVPYVKFSYIIYKEIDDTLPIRVFRDLDRYLGCDVKCDYPDYTISTEIEYTTYMGEPSTLYSGNYIENEEQDLDNLEKHVSVTLYAKE